MKKKICVLIFFLLALTLGERARAQELIGLAGAGLFRTVPTTERTIGNFEFVEGRLMFGNKMIRFGPMANYTWAYAKQSKEDPYYYKGRFYTLGAAVDNWGSILRLNYYSWINSGIRWGYDRGASDAYNSWQKDKLFLIQGGLILTKLESFWFSNSLLIAEWQEPIEKGSARYSVTPGIVTAGTPYEKGGFRLTGETGIRKFVFFVKGQEVRFEPIAHLGYGSEKAYNRQYVEYGGGFAFSYFREWQRELFKVKAFQRQDLDGYNPQSNDGSQPPRLQVEVVVNLLNWKLKN
ncbi:MAG: hypothetical protein NTY31_02245 [Candidatus Falkowbacteria bacterium]|nr:hypothetical protein [Candidatus Falkowbacteria bacterium]